MRVRKFCRGSNFAVNVLFLSFFFAGGTPGSSAQVVGQSTDLHTTLQIAWESTHEPIVATSPRGMIYVIWLGKASEKPAIDAGIPLIPNDFTFPAEKPGWESVPGISIYDGKAWSKPQLLVAGARECTPLYAWCSGEGLNLLVGSSAAESFYHLRYHPESKTWTRLHVVPGSPSSYSAYQWVGGVLHVGVASDHVAYLKFDGKKWSKPVTMEGTKSTSRPHLAATKDGAVHMLWRAPSGGEFGHLIVAADGTSRKMAVDFPILRDEFDAAADPDGNLAVAYLADVAENNADANAVHVRTFKNNHWSEPTLIGKSSGLMLGGVRTLSVNGQTLLSWVHRADYNSGSMHVSGPVRSFVMLSEKGWSSPQPMAAAPDGFMGGGFMGSHFVGLHADELGRVHVAWSEGPCNYYALTAEVPAVTPTTQRDGR